MKRTLFLIVSILLILLVLPYPQIINGKENGSPGGKTNSPVDVENCTDCHNGSINTGPGNILISSDIPTLGYVPGETYSITTNITESGCNTFGFELTAEGGTGFSPKIGDWTVTNSSTTKKVNLDGAVTHKSAGISGFNNKTWSVNWTAPVQVGEGTINFYAAGIAANGNGNNSGDNVYTTQYTVDEQQSAYVNNHSNIFNIAYSNNTITISCNTKLNKLMIYNIDGKLIIHDYHDNIPMDINTSNFAKGIYMIRATDVLNNKYSNKINIY